MRGQHPLSDTYQKANFLLGTPVPFNLTINSRISQIFSWFAFGNSIFSDLLELSKEISAQFVTVLKFSKFVVEWKLL